MVANFVNIDRPRQSCYFENEKNDIQIPQLKTAFANMQCKISALTLIYVSLSL